MGHLRRAQSEGRQQKSETGSWVTGFEGSKETTVAGALEWSLVIGGEVNRTGRGGAWRPGAFGFILGLWGSQRRI
jgi:adenylylsulfate kinase-like enzyme